MIMLPELGVRLVCFWAGHDWRKVDSLGASIARAAGKLEL